MLEVEGKAERRVCRRNALRGNMVYHVKNQTISKAGGEGDLVEKKKECRRPASFHARSLGKEKAAGRGRGGARRGNSLCRATRLNGG